MDLSIRKFDGTVVLGFANHVDLVGETSLLFKEKLKGLIAEGHQNVVMDLSNVGFVDSQGLGALISGLKVMRQVDGNLCLANVSQPVEAVLRITRLIRVFDVAANVEEALAALERHAARSGS